MNALRNIWNSVTSRNQGRTVKKASGKRQQSCKLDVEKLEDRVVPTVFFSVRASSAVLHSAYFNSNEFASPGTPGWFQYNFQDAGVRNMAQADFTRDHMITRNDMIGLFNEVESNGIVSSAAFHDLGYIVSQASTLKLPDYVSYLANKVVNGDPANSTYSYLVTYNWINGIAGRQVTVPLGNLVPGSPSGQLYELVDKWFMGGDVPETSIIDPTNPSPDPASFDYGYDSVGTLFDPGTGAISYTDIHQGYTGDCWLLSAAADIANQSPATIQNMFIDNGDGTYTVRLFDAYDHAAFVTVNRWLPENISDGTFVFANQGMSLSDPNAPLWVPLMEKAVAQLNHSGRLDNFRDGSDSYQGLSGDFGYFGMLYLTGLSQGNYETSLDQTAFSAAVTGGDLVVLNTPGQGGDPLQSEDGYIIVPDHAYAVVGYDAPDGLYYVFNPWGFGANDAADPQIEVTWSQITDIFASYDWGTNPQSIPVGASTLINNGDLSAMLVNGTANAGGAAQGTPPIPMAYQDEITKLFSAQPARKLDSLLTDLDLYTPTKQASVPWWAFEKVWSEFEWNKGDIHL